MFRLAGRGQVSFYVSREGSGECLSAGRGQVGV